MMKSSKNGKATDAQGEAEREHTVPSGPVAIVLAGAGARGAYEAGFIAALLPKLEPRPTIFVGTSAGAINAALLAANAHRPPEAAAEAIMKSWSNLSYERVLGPLWKSVPIALAQYAVALAFGREPPQSLADTRPLQASLGEPDLLNWANIEDNLNAGRVHALGFAATETGSGRTKIFYQTKPGWVASGDSVLRTGAKPKNGHTNGNGHSNGHSKSSTPAQTTDKTQAIDYVSTKLGPDHVRASAAIPVLFPPVMIRIGMRDSYFIDGGIRLNAPLKPALQLGAEGLVVVSTDPRHFGTPLAVEPKSPTMQGQVLQVLRALFADRMVEDIRVLLKRNSKVRQDPEDKKPKDREIPIIFGGPGDQDRVGGVAARAIEELLRGFPVLRFFKKLDVSVLRLLTSVSATSGPDLISYILFEPMFINAALRAGIQDASALLNDYPNPKDLWAALVDRDERREHWGDDESPAPMSPQPSA